MSEQPQLRGALAEALSGTVAALRLVLGLALLAYLGSGFYVVRQHERAVELRLGRPAGQGERRVNGPGLHVAWPAPIGEVRRVDVGTPRTVATEAFWYALTDAERATGKEGAPPETLRPGRDGYLITADRNLLHARWEATYEVTDPARYLFAAGDVEATVESALVGAVSQAAVERAVDAALREQQTFRERVEALLTARLQGLDLGLRPRGVRLLELAPPRQVRAAFDQASQAAERWRQAVDEANRQATRRQQEAAGEAARIVAQAQARSATYVQRLRAEAERFEQLLPEFRADPELFRRRLRGAARRAAAERADLIVLPRSGELELREHRQPRRQAPVEPGP